MDSAPGILAFPVYTLLILFVAIDLWRKDRSLWGFAWLALIPICCVLGWYRSGLGGALLGGFLAASAPIGIGVALLPLWLLIETWRKSGNRKN